MMAVPFISAASYHMLWTDYGTFYEVAVSKNGEYIVATNSVNGIFFYAWNNSNPIWWYNESGFEHVAISADGNHVVASQTPGESPATDICYWNNSIEMSGYQPFTWNSSCARVGDLDISDNGSCVAVGWGEFEASVTFYSNCTEETGYNIYGQWTDFMGFEISVDVLDISANGKYLAVGGENYTTESSGLVKFYKDAWSGTDPNWVNNSLPLDIMDICVSDDGYAVVAIDAEGDSLFYWANSTELSGSPVANWTSPGPYWRLDISSDGDEVATVTEWSSSLYFWNESRTLSGQPTEKWSKTEPEHHQDVAVSDDGSIIAATGYDITTIYLQIYSSNGTMIYNYTDPYGENFDILSMSGKGDVLATKGSVNVFALADLDYGDAPEVGEYGTIDGARHLIDNVTYLGSSVDPDPNGQPDPHAMGDDTDGTDDEDGVVFTTPLFRGHNAGVNVTASTSGYLYAWVDFDGDWAWEEEERVFTNESLTAGVNSLQFTVPMEANETTFARFRFTTQPFPDPSEAPWEYAPDGEVEDYNVTVFDPPVISAENPDIANRTLNITVCNEFNVEIWIRNITEGFSMVGFDFLVDWDPALTEYVGHTVYDHGWNYTFGINEAAGELWLIFPINTTITFTEDDVWANITFHCLGEGVSTVNVTSVDTIWLWRERETFGVDPAPYSITCNQIAEPEDRKPEPQPVGGEILHNAPQIITLVLTIIATSTIITLTKNRNKGKLYTGKHIRN
jgi:hypothetical protein